jgi:hypothetical protein
VVKSSLLVNLSLLCLLSSKISQAQTTSSAHNQSESQGSVSTNKKRISPRKRRSPSRRELKPTSHNPETNLNESIRTIPHTPNLENLNTEFPGSLLGLGFDATPGFYFEQRLSRGSVGLATHILELAGKILDTDLKSSLKREYGALGAEHRVLFASNKLFSKVAFNVTRFRIKQLSTYQSNSTSRETSDVEAEDNFTPSVAWGFQAAPGFWLGVHADWTQRHTRTEINPKDVIVKSEMSRQTISAEFRNPLAHAGFEYSVSNSKDKTVSWSLPMRINLWNQLFVGSTLTQTTTIDYYSPYQDEGSSYAGEIGIQTGRAAMSLQYNYEVTKSAFDVSSEPESAVSVFTYKRKSTSLVTAFGSKTGTRFAWDINYAIGRGEGGYLTKAKESALLSSLTIIWSR